MFTIPNIMTMARIAIIPVMFICFLVENTGAESAIWLCFALYVIASITDFIDGWWARKYNQITAFGTFLDPISDKIFVGCLLIMLVGFGRLDGLAMIPALIIMVREFLVSGLREFLGPHDIQLPVTKLAKWKTATQMISLGFLIITPITPYTAEIGLSLLSIAAALTVITGWGYLRAGLDVMKKMD